MLNIVAHGEETAQPTLVIAHGLFGSARNWGGIARRLAPDRLVIAVDLRNHGDSPHFDTNSYPEMAGDLAEVIEGLGGAPVDLMGHSMGGKAAMVLALTRPDLAGRLIVVDMAPKTYEHSQLRYVEAMRSVDLASVRRRSDADAMLRASVEEAALRAFLLQSLALEGGVASWKLNLAALGDQMPAIMGFPELASRYPGPALFVAGEASDYVSVEDHSRIEALFPRARFEVVAGAGHWIHAEQPDAFLDLVVRFLGAPTKA